MACTLALVILGVPPAQDPLTPNASHVPSLPVYTSTRAHAAQIATDQNASTAVVVTANAMDAVAQVLQLAYHA